MPIELKTIDACKDEVAKEHGYEDWLMVFNHYRHNKLSVFELSDLENEAIKAFAFHLLDYAAQEATTTFKSSGYYLGHPKAKTTIDTNSITNIKNKIK